MPLIDATSQIGSDRITTGRGTSPLEGVLDILSGLAQGLEAYRAEREARQMQALALLARNPRMELGPADPSAVQPTNVLDRLLTGQRFRPTPGGMPVMNVGGVPITVQQRQPLPPTAFGLGSGMPVLPSSAGQGMPAGPPSAGITERTLVPSARLASGPAPGLEPGATTVAGLQPPPEPDLGVTHQDLLANPLVQGAWAQYQALPSEDNAVRMQQAVAAARRTIREERQRQYQIAWEQYKHRVEQQWREGETGRAVAKEKALLDPRLEQARREAEATEPSKTRIAAAQGRESGKIQVAVKRLQAIDEEAEAAQTVHRAMDEIERLITEGVYGNSPEERAIMLAYRSGTPYRNDPTAQRTARLQELGAQLVAARGLGTHISNKDAEYYARAAGNFERAKNPGEMRESLKSMRTVANRVLDYANQAHATFEKESRLPPYQEGKYTLGAGSDTPVLMTVPMAAEIAKLWNKTVDEVLDEASKPGSGFTVIRGGSQP